MGICRLFSRVMPSPSLPCDTSLAAIRPLREELETLCEQSERVRHLLSLAERHPQAGQTCVCVVRRCTLSVPAAPLPAVQSISRGNLGGHYGQSWRVGGQMNCDEHL